MLYSSFEVALTDNQTNSGGGGEKSLSYSYLGLSKFDRVSSGYFKDVAKIPKKGTTHLLSFKKIYLQQPSL